MWRINLVQGGDSEGGWRGRSGHYSVPTRIPVLKEAKDTQGINSGGSPNDNMASALLNSMQSMKFVCIMFGLRIQLHLNMFFTCKKSRE